MTKTKEKSKMQKKILTSQFLEDHLKKGWCLDDFTRHFGVDREEFDRMLGKVTKNTAYVNNYKSRLATNEKRRNKRNDSANRGVIEEPEKTVEILPEEKPQNQELLKLQEDEEKLKESISENEQTEKSLKKQEEQAKKKLEQLNKEIADITLSLKTISENISKNSLEYKENKEKLQSVQEQIKELTKITIFAYSDGEIEIVGDEEVPGNWTESFAELIESESVEDCTVKQIRQLVKVITISNTYSDRIVEVSWGDEDIQKIFESLKK